MSHPPTCLGIHIGHDRALSITRNGHLSFHLAVERLDRKKHSDSAALPIAEIRTVLKRLDLSQGILDAVCVTYHGIQPEKMAPSLESLYKEAFPDFKGCFSALDHHLSHALGALSCSPFDEAMVLVADGAGDARLWGTQSESLFHVSRNNFYLLEERLQDRPLAMINRPEFYVPDFFSPVDHRRQISLGLKYEQATYLCGFGPGQAGQTMALAAYGKPLFDVDHLLPRDFGFSLRYVDLLDQLNEVAADHGLTLTQFARQNGGDVAATVQVYLENSLLKLVEYAVRTYDPINLCFAGGVFLNCLTNRRIADRHHDRGLFFLPPSSDEGQSIGAAAYAHWEVTGTLPPVEDSFPFLGFDYSQEECLAALKGAALPFQCLNDTQLSSKLATLLESGKICALLRGRSEAGPRALGHRSILGDPRTPQTKARIDAGIKRRAEFRPYAPVVPITRAGEYFDLDRESPHMLFTATVMPQYRAALQAVVHVDGTSRIQTVSNDSDPFMFDLLQRFEQRTGIAALLNTSFNDEKEPIVERPSDAVRTFLATDLDVLVLGSAICIKQER